MARWLASTTGAALLAGSALAATPPPANDECAAAMPIPALRFEHSEPAIALAAGAPDDPLPSCNGGRAFNSVWYRYTPAVSGRVVLTTRTSWDDSFVWVGTGSCGSLSEVACSDDKVGNYSAELEFLAVAGTTYQVMVGSTFPVAWGQINLIAETGAALNAPAPVNDLCAAATPITAVPAVLTDTGWGATESAGDLDPPCWPGADNYSLWYSLMLPADRQVRIDTTNSTDSTWVTVATGSCGNLELIDCDWTSGVNAHGVVDFLARAGVPYLVQVSRVFPPGVGDQVEVLVTDGSTAPIHVTVTDEVTGLPIEGAHVQVRDVWGGYYLMREDWTDAAGQRTLYLVEPDTYSLQVVAQGHQSWSQPFTLGTTALDFAVALPPMAPPPPVPDEPTRIVAAAGTQIVTFLPDGSDPRIIDLPQFLLVRFATWSPDGAEIGFMGYELAHGWNEIWAIRPDGSGLRRITDFQGEPETMVNLRWSPAGTEFAFDAEIDRFTLTRAIHTVDATTGTSLRVLEVGERPRWSPDGSMIAYLDAWGPRVMRRDGSHVATLNTFIATYLDWSPDGTRIAISRGNEDIWAIPIEGRAPLKVSATQSNSQTESLWSPDSCEIAYFDRQSGVTYWNVAWADGAGFRSSMPLIAWSEIDWARHPQPPDAPGDRSPRVELLDPNGGERLEIGKPYTIRMPAVDDGGIVSRDLWLLFSGQPPIAIATGLAGPLDDYVWVVGNHPSDAGALLKVVVRDAAGQEHSDTSRYPFSIAGASDSYHTVRLTAPVPGQVVLAGDTLRIAWDYDERRPFTSDGFHLELSLDGGNSFRRYIDDFVPSTARFYDWSVPAYASSEAVIRIRSSGAYDETGEFSIQPAAVETRAGGANGAKPLLLGVRAGADAVFHWGLRGTLAHVHRSDDKTVLPALWAAPAQGSSTAGTWTDPEPSPAPSRPWLYQVFFTDCSGESQP